MTIRLLTAPDAEALRLIRLRALQENPEAFGSTYAEECERPLEAFAARLGGDPAEACVLGAADQGEGRLLGMIGCRREWGTKRRHVAVVWGLFVAPEARNRGLGAALLDAVIARARGWPGLEQLTLSVVPANVAARALYVSRGFQPIGLAPRALRDAAGHHDLEYFRLPLDAEA